MIKNFKEWLMEEEKWATTEKGHKIAYDPKTGEITKGLFAGGNVKNLAELSKNIGSKFAGKKSVKDTVKKSSEKASKLSKALDAKLNSSGGVGSGEIKSFQEKVRNAETIHDNAENAEKKLKSAFEKEPELKKAFDKLNQARFKSADQYLEDVEDYVNGGKGNKVSSEVKADTTQERKNALKEFKNAMRKYIKNNPKDSDEIYVHGYWNYRKDK